MTPTPRTPRSAAIVPTRTTYHEVVVPNGAELETPFGLRIEILSAGGFGPDTMFKYVLISEA
jgi:hypothetical protein